MLEIRPLYKHLSDIYTKTYLNHIFLNAHRYQFGWMQTLTGGVRCGKSMTICTLSDLLTMRELDEYNFGFTPKEYIKSLDYAETGDTLIWSEMGTSLGARKWWSISNILTGEIIQTMMIIKPIIFIDTPDLSFIDVQARKLIYAYSEAKRWEENPVKLWLYRISITRRTGDVYFPHPTIKANNRICKLKAITLKMKAPKEVWIKYNKKQLEYKEKLRKKNLKVIEQLEEEMTGVEVTTYDLINQVSEDIQKYKNKFGRLDWHLIKTQLNISENKAKEIKTFIQKEEGESEG